MKCKNCNNPIPKGELFCRKCGHPSPIVEQRNKIAGVRERLASLPREKAHSPLFVIIAIVFTLMTVGRGMSLLYGDYSVLLEGVFMGIAVIGIWLCYTAKDNKKMASALRTASIHDAYVRVLFTVWIVLVSVLFIGFAIICFVAACILATNKSAEIDEALPSVLVSLGIITLIGGGVLMLAITFIRWVFASRRAYYVSLAKLSEGNPYTEKRAPAAASFVFGGVGILLTLMDLSFSVLLSGLAGGLINGLSNLFGLGDYIGIDLSEVFGNLGTPDIIDPSIAEIFGFDGFLSIDELGIVDWLSGILGEYVNYFTSIITVFLATMGISSFVMGLYFILTGVWMTSVHKRAKELSEELNREIAARAELERLMKEEDGEKHTSKPNDQRDEHETEEAEASLPAENDADPTAEVIAESEAQSEDFDTPPALPAPEEKVEVEASV